MSELYFDRRMSDVEGLMWRLEKDPYLTSTFGNVTILDRKPDVDLLRRRFERASFAIPRLRQRVQPAPGSVSPPTWVEDPDFSIENHVRHIALPKPGSMRQLLDLASLIVADPFDRTRPLWQFVLVDGLRGGKSALIQKMHHTVTDGERGVQLSLQYLDFERDAPDRPPLVAPDSSEPEPPGTGGGDGVHAFIAGSLRLPLGVARQVRDLLADPTSLPNAGAAAASTLRGIVSQLSDTDKARSPLWTARSLRRHIEVTRAPFRETKDAAARLGGTINTAFLTAAADAASKYHVEMGSPTETLRASMAVSTRTESSGANAFSVVRMLVPTAEMPIAERFAAIHEATAVAKDQSKSAGLDTLAAVASALPTSVVTRLARQQTQTVDFATSNVRGAPMEMYVAGAQLLENYAIGPLAGVAFNVTMLSYLGSLDMGINIDAAAVEDPELLKRCLDRSLAELLKV
ncbi:MAG TPA: wax ester/triacylglycerol synthase domain-containing protein [Ilumatobacteraceae bacterium]|nr:wax ester/triacylglycerol synthase domain-containing protein [Ilumatobacteraceae bacterium]